MSPDPARRASVVMSPRDAAIGIETLSGLMLNLFEAMMITDITPPRTNEATEAVMSADAVKRSPWSRRVGD